MSIISDATNFLMPYVAGHVAANTAMDIYVAKLFGTTRSIGAGIYSFSGTLVQDALFLMPTLATLSVSFDYFSSQKELDGDEAGLKAMFTTGIVALTILPYAIYQGTKAGQYMAKKCGYEISTSSAVDLACKKLHLYPLALAIFNFIHNKA